MTVDSESRFIQPHILVEFVVQEFRASTHLAAHEASAPMQLRAEVRSTRFTNCRIPQSFRLR